MGSGACVRSDGNVQRHGFGVMRRTACVTVSLLALGCASVETVGNRGSGTLGPVAWEVSDIGRVVSSDNQRVRWSYVITLRNTGDQPTQLTGPRDGRAYSDAVTTAVVESSREFSGTRATPPAAGTLAGMVVAPASFTVRLRQDTPCMAEFGGPEAIADAAARLTVSYRGAGCPAGSAAASIVVTRAPT